MKENDFGRVKVLRWGVRGGKEGIVCHNVGRIWAQITARRGEKDLL
jgi:hypothetical protein